MNKYHVVVWQYSSTAPSHHKEILAEYVDFRDGRVSFYKNKTLIASYPSNLTSIYKIEYNHE